MTEVRACRPDDIDAVTRLFVKAFRKGIEPPPAMSEYFHRLYFENPWFDPDLSSVVIERDAAIVGFLGVMPLPVQLDGRPVRLAVGGNLMVDPDDRDPMIAMRLLRRYFSGPQDAALTDTANTAAARLWAAHGGSTARFHSMRWLIPLNPGSLGLAAVRRHPTARRLAWLGRPVALPVDALARRRMRAADGSLGVQHVGAQRVREFIGAVGPRGYVHIDADAAGWTWLVDMCRAKTQFGPLFLLAFVGHDGRDVGVAMYYPNRGSLGQVVLMLALDGHHGAVLDALCREAAREGTAALCGQADPRFMLALGERASVYVQRNEFVTVHSQDGALGSRIASGEVALNRLIGEWWTRMQGDTF